MGEKNTEGFKESYEEMKKRVLQKINEKIKLNEADKNFLGCRKRIHDKILNSKKNYFGVIKIITPQIQTEKQFELICEEKQNKEIINSFIGKMEKKNIIYKEEDFTIEKLTKKDYETITDYLIMAESEK